MKALSQSELSRLLDSITNPKLRCMVALAARHGCRASEICKLKRVDVDMQKGLITIRRLKGSLTSVQPLGEMERGMLKDILAHPTQSPYVFVLHAGRPISRSTFWRQFRAACGAVGIAADKSHPHALKHFCGFALVQANVSLPIIQAALGHRSINSTAIYARPSQDVVDKAMASVFDVKEN